MPTQYTVLGQVSPVANTLTTLYQTPASTNAIVSTITVHNHSDANVSYSLRVKPDNETANDKHFIVRGGIVPERELVTISGAVTMNAEVTLSCNTNGGAVTFNAYGAEVTPAA